MSDYYEPMTPEFRRKINESFDKMEAQMDGCERNVYINMRLVSIKTARNMINSLPDGFLVPMINEGGKR